MIIKPITLILLILLLFSFKEEVRASEIKKEQTYLNNIVKYNTDKSKSTLELEFLSENVDFYYINICDKTNDSPGCKNEPNIYTEAFQKNEKQITLAFRKEGIQGIEIAMKDKDGVYKGISFLIIEISPKDFLENSFVAPKDDVFIQSLLRTEFKGYEKWSPATKVKKVHQYITSNYKYDFGLYNKIQQGIIDFNNPDLEKMKNEKIGICYDLAVFNVAILRAMEVPSKVVVGKAIASNNLVVNHAWNLVYINNEWKLIDTTWDLGKVFSYKVASSYQMQYEF